jgi:DNA-binding response OmpR family regulator
VLILAVDDDATVRRILKLRLELKGYSVVSLENGSEVLAYLSEPKNAPPDLIISDVMMPGMDGYQLCDEVRKLGVKKPFLFLTSRGQSSDKVRGMQAGADDYILKPFDPHELEAKVAARLR